VSRKNLLKTALRYNPNDHDANTALGDFYFTANDFQNAGKYYKNALIVKSNSCEALSALILTACELKNEEEAVKYLRKLMTLCPESPDIPYLSAKISLLADKKDEAVKYLENAVKQAENPYYFHALGTLTDNPEYLSKAQNSGMSFAYKTQPKRMFKSK